MPEKVEPNGNGEESYALFEKSTCLKLVDRWINRLNEKGEVRRIPRIAVRIALEGCGANFKLTEEEKESLAQYTNKAKARGMRRVWGKWFAEYKKWGDKWIENYEEKTDQQLPALKASGKKTSGIRQFLGELTAFAAGEMSFIDLKEYWEARLLNGKLWEEGRREDRVRVQVPTKKEPILLASIPPGFVQAVWGKIKSWQE